MPKSFRRYLLVVLMVLLPFSSLHVYSQQSTVNMQYEDITVKNAIKRIQKTTGMSFLYYSKDVDTGRHISINATNASISEVVEQLLVGQPLDYTIADKYIIIRRKKDAASPKKFTTVQGNVVNSHGVALNGVTVIQKSSNKMDITDIHGHFSLEVPDLSPLSFSCIGLKSKEQTAAPNMFVVMLDDVMNINEIIVLGYGEIKKENLTGAVSIVKGKKIEERLETNVSNALAGASSGLTTTRKTDNTNIFSQLNIRGVTTISDSSPVVLIDGVPGDINEINPNDVEDVTLLKDAASAAIYGSRAAAGVILIKTKRASAGASSMEYRYETSILTPTELPQYVSYKRFMEMTNEVKYNDNPNGGWYQMYSQETIDNYATLHSQNPYTYPMTNWEDVLLKKNASNQVHSLTLTSGGKGLSTMITMRYDKSDALYINDREERYFFRMNNDISVLKYLDAQFDMSFYRNEYEYPHSNPFSDGGINMSPLYTPTLSNGLWAECKRENLLATMTDGGTTKYISNKLCGIGKLIFKPLRGLKISAVIAPNFIFNQTKNFRKKVPYYNELKPTEILGYMSNFSETSLKETRDNAYEITAQLISNSNRLFGPHEVTLMAGYEYYYTNNEMMWGSGNNYTLSNYPYLDNASTNATDAGGNAWQYSYRSFFGRANYAFKKRYLAEFNMRYDGSSRFAANHRWADFPSFSAGWVISREKWMKKFLWISELKLRASWGKLGNERIGNYYPYISYVSFDSPLMTDGTTIVAVTSAAQHKYAVNDVTWETTETSNIGVDASLFSNRLNIKLDIYDKTTKNMLLALQIPLYMGYWNPDVNAGSMNTRGWDLDIGYNNHIGNMKYSISYNVSNFTSKMGSMNGTVFLGDKIKKEGSEYDQWYGYICDGIYQTQKDVDNSAKLNQNVQVGDLKYRDISGPDGMPDGKISPEYDRVLLKSSMPHWIYGLNINLTYKEWDFSTSLSGIGYQWIRMSPFMVETDRFDFPALIDGQYWSAKNTDAQNLNAIYPRLTRSNIESNYCMSSFWLFRGRYLRAKNITLGYTLPTQLTNKFLVSKLRFYIALNNFFCINNYPTGWDPESEPGAYPVNKSVLFGLNVSF